MFLGAIDQSGTLPVHIATMTDGVRDPDAMFDLGLQYANGRAVPLDLVAAHKWFNLAAAKGKKEAVVLRREVAEQMSESDIAMAQREARKWLTSH